MISRDLLAQLKTETRGINIALKDGYELRMQKAGLYSVQILGKDRFEGQPLFGVEKPHLHDAIVDMSKNYLLHGYGYPTQSFSQDFREPATDVYGQLERALRAVDGKSAQDREYFIECKKQDGFLRMRSRLVYADGREGRFDLPIDVMTKSPSEKFADIYAELLLN
jgi:hypothetical protein